MTRTATVYGFGSAYGRMDAGNDVDLLIVHENTDRASCKLAIRCKRQLSDHIRNAHITMLSKGEEAHFEFIRRAQAVPIGDIRESHIDADLAALKPALPQSCDRNPISA